MAPNVICLWFNLSAGNQLNNGANVRYILSERTKTKGRNLP
jgi:hypothetical protein